jgi:hypothetical protein
MVSAARQIVISRSRAVAPDEVHSATREHSLRTLVARRDAEQGC